MTNYLKLTVIEDNSEYISELYIPGENKVAKLLTDLEPIITSIKKHLTFKLEKVSCEPKDLMKFNPLEAYNIGSFDENTTDVVIKNFSEFVSELEKIKSHDYKSEYPEFSELELSFVYNHDVHMAWMDYGEKLFINLNGLVKTHVETSIEIDFPTGNIIATDWIHGSNDIFEGLNDQDINTIRGQLFTTLDYAKLNVCHMYVGNSSPQVMKSNDQSFWIGYQSEDVPSQDEQIGFICTDLWWATVVDVQTMKDLYAKKLNIQKTDFKTLDTKIKPGIYNVTYHGVSDDYDKDPDKYITFEWLRPSN